MKSTDRFEPYKNLMFQAALLAAIGGLVGYLISKAVASTPGNGTRSYTRRPQARARWEDLSLEPGELELLRDIALELRRESRKAEDVAVGARGAKAGAVIGLVAGTRVNGKATPAEVLADELQVDLLQVNVSKVVSEYSRDTEKALQRVFSAARKTGAILLLDEADALFGKRSEVKDSHDRYANVEVGNLLERMNAHDGVIFLATNHKQNVDAAFLGRLRFVFDLPSSASLAVKAERPISLQAHRKP